MKSRQKSVRVRVALTVLIALATLLVSCFLLLSIKIINNLNLFQPAFTAPIRPEDPGDTPSNPSDPPAGDTYTFSDEYFAYDDYINHNEFYIGTDEGLMSFLQALSNGYYAGYYRGVYKFDEKQIFLTSDVVITQTYNAHDPSTEDDFAEEFWFDGTFDGQGHTITYACDDYIQTSQWFGFMRRIGDTGVVKNTKFKDFKIKQESMIECSYSAVGLFGEASANATIENCVIDSITFASAGYSYSTSTVAPFVGTNNGTIKNCMVIGNYICEQPFTYDSTCFDRVIAHRFTGAGEKGAINSIYAVSEIENLYGKYNVGDNTYFKERENEKDGTEGRCVGCNSAWYGTVLDANSTTGNSGSVWYRYPKTPSSEFRGYYGTRRVVDENNSLKTIDFHYNMYLRAFIKFDEVEFVVAYSNRGDLIVGGTKCDSIKYLLPSNYSEVEEIGDNKLRIMNEQGGFDTIIPQPEGTNKFSEWEETTSSSGKIVWRANFYETEMKLRFIVPDRLWLRTLSLKLDCKESPMLKKADLNGIGKQVPHYEFTVLKGSTLYNDWDDHEKFPNTITYTFTDVNLGEVQIVYRTSEILCINKAYFTYDDKSIGDRGLEFNEMELTSNCCVVLETTIKEYEITLG